jgi:hypothetical protein
LGRFAARCPSQGADHFFGLRGASQRYDVPPLSFVIRIIAKEFWRTTTTGTMITGSSGADWFLIGSEDKITDYHFDKPRTNKDGDVVTIVA